MPDTHIPARRVRKPLPIYVAGHTQAMFRAATRHGYRVLTSGRVGGTQLLAEQYADIVAAFAAEKVPLSRAHLTLNRPHHRQPRGKGCASRRTRAISRGSRQACGAGRRSCK